MLFDPDCIALRDGMNILASLLTCSSGRPEREFTCIYTRLKPGKYTYIDTAVLNNQMCYNKYKQLITNSLAGTLSTYSCFSSFFTKVVCDLGSVDTQTLEVYITVFRRGNILKPLRKVAIFIVWKIRWAWLIINRRCGYKSRFVKGRTTKEQ